MLAKAAMILVMGLEKTVSVVNSQGMGNFHSLPQSRGCRAAAVYRPRILKLAVMHGLK